MSRVYSQSESGAYDAIFANPSFNGCRVRYNSLEGKQQAAQRISEAEQQSFYIEIECMGYVNLSFENDIAINLALGNGKSKSYVNLKLVNLKYKLSSGEEKTILKLVPRVSLERSTRKARGKTNVADEAA